MIDNAAGKPSSQDQAMTKPQQTSPPTMLDLDVGKLTDVGRARPHNEDYVDYAIPADGQQLARKGSLFLVADGMGGHQAGEVASQGAVETAIEYYYQDTGRDVPTSLVRAFRAANQHLYDQAQSDASKAGMGTTLVAAVVLGRKVTVANVGDSRAYLINQQGITQITEDHSWVEEQVRAGLLTQEQAQKHPQRNLVTRALGSKPSVEVDLFEGEISAGDALLLCSDGLTGRVSDPEISTIVQQHGPQEAARRLVAEANERGGNDNITVLIVSAQEEAPTIKAPVIPAPGERAGRRLPLVPILVGLAILILVAATGVWAWSSGLIGAPDEAPTPSATMAAPTATTAAPQPSATQAGVPAATATSSPTTEPTSTLASTPSPTTEEPTATDTPVPSDTPTPTATATPTITQTDTPEPTPTATNTPRFALPQPTTLQPQENEELNAEVTFEWAYQSDQLAPSNGFRLLIWREGNEEELLLDRFVAKREDNTYRSAVDLVEILDSQDVGQRFFWSVMVVQSEGGDQLSEQTRPLSFVYRGPTSSARR